MLDIFTNAPENAGHEQDRSFDAGRYPAVIVECRTEKYVQAEGLAFKERTNPETVASYAASGTIPGDRIVVTAQITEGQYQGRKITERYLIKPSSDAKAVSDNYSLDDERNKGVNNLCGMRKRTGVSEPKAWSDFVGSALHIHITRREKAGKVYNGLDMLIKKDEDLTPPEVKSSAAVLTDEPPF